MQNKFPKALSKTTYQTTLKTSLTWALGLGMPFLLSAPRALSVEISYAGRLTEASGKSVEGPLDFAVRFYQSESGGDMVGPTLSLSGIELRDGVFQLSLNLDSSQMATVFGDGSKAIFVEVEAGGKVYGRQRFIAAPMALRVPVDSSQLAYNNDGKLSISQIELSRVSGLSAALAAKADTSAVTSGNLRSANNLSDLASPAAARTNLGLGPMATASSLNDSDISPSAAIAQSKISGLATSLSGKEPAITAGTTAQYLRGDKSWTDFNTAARGSVGITVPLTYNSGTGVFGIGQASGVADGFLTSSDFTAFNTKQAAISAATTVDAGTVTTALQNGVEIKPYGTGAGNAGELRFDDLAAGGTFYVGFKAPDTLAANRIWTLPAADGTGGQLLTTDGSGNLSWVNTGGTGTVTSVNLTQPSEGITVSGGPITGSGSITLALSNDLAAVEGLSTNGGVERTGANTWSTYPITNAGKAILADADNVAQRTTLGLGALSTAAAVSGGTAGTITDDSITNADINSGAAIATSKLSGSVTSITGHGLGLLAPLDTVGSTQIANDSIMNTDISPSAAIDATKIGGGGVTSTEFDFLGSVTSDIQTQLTAKAPLASPTFTGVLGIPLGAAATPSLAFTGDANTGLWSSGADTLNLSTSGSERMRVDSNGNLGIGTTTPPSLLSAGASSQFQVDSAGDLIKVKNITYSWPGAQGGASTVLTNNGSGTLSWGAPTTGTVTSVNLTQPSEGITVSGGPITGSGSITLALGNDLAAVEGISTTGGVERTAANTWSTYTLTTAGKDLIDDATPAAQRATLGLNGLAILSAVSSTEITDNTIMDADINASAAIAQSKISGLTTSLSGKEPTITAGTATDFYRGDKSWTDFNTTARSAVSITAPLTYNSGTGVFGLGQASGVADGYLSSTNFLVFNNKQAAITAASTVDAGTVTTALQNGVQVKPYGVAAGNTGELRFDDLAAGGTFYVGFKAPDTLAGNRIWTLPVADGTTGQVLATNGTGTLSWATGAAGSVTSVGLTQPTEGITVSGGPITSSGSMTLALANDLAAVEGLSTTGGVERTAANTWSTYTLTAAGKALIDDADITAQRTTLGLGSLATLAAVGSTEITNDSIMNVDINSAAAIADTKLDTISTAGKVSGSAITSGTIAGATILNTTGTITTSTSITGLGVNGTTFMAGTGDAGASPVGGLIRAASGAGTDIAGSNLTVTSGNGTGTGGSGSILFQTAPVAASSATANTMATRMTILNNGNVGIGTTAPVGTLDVAGTGIFTGTLYVSNNRTSGGAGATGTITLGDANISKSYGSAFTFGGSSIIAVDFTATRDVSVARRLVVGQALSEPPTVAGMFLRQSTATFTDNSTAASGTATGVAFNGFAAPTLAASNSSVTTTNAYTSYISGAPIKGTNNTATNVTALGIGSTNVGAQTNSYGLFVNSQTGASNNYAAVFQGGNVGIGSSNPGALLDVNGTVRATSFIGTGNSDWNNQNINNLSSLGIGTTSPSGNLSFGGAAARTLQVDRNYTADTAGSTLSVASGGATSGATDKNGGSLVLSSGTATGSGSSTIEFKTSSPGSAGTADTAPTTKMVITGSGNVGIGTTAPVAKLEIQGTGNNTNAISNLAEFGSGTSVTAGNIYAIAVDKYFVDSLMMGINKNTATGTVPANTAFISSNIGGLSLGRGNSAGLPSTADIFIAGSGNVGIGTTSPVAVLNVKNAGSSSNTMYEAMRLESGAAGANSGVFMQLGNGVTSNLGRISAIDDSGAGSFGGSLAFSTKVADGNGTTASTERMRILYNGNVGIGTTSPSLALDVMGSLGIQFPGAIWDHIYLTHDSSTAAIRAGGAESGMQLQVGTGGSGTYGGQSYTTAMTLMPSGNVGIGTTSPSSGLELGTGVGVAGVPVGVYVSEYTGTAGYANYFGNWSSSGLWGIGPATGGADNTIRIGNVNDDPNHAWSATQNVNLVIGGNVGIGTTSPAVALQVIGTIASAGADTLTPSGTTQTIDLLTSNTQNINLGSATGTVTLTLSGGTKGAVYSIFIEQGATPRSVVWPASVKWEGGTPPVLSGANATDLVSLIFNGTFYFATVTKNFQ